MDLFRAEFISTERFRGVGGRRGRGGTGRGRRRAAAPAAPSGPKCRGKIKKMVRDRGFGFIRGDDGKEVFFHRSGLNAADYDVLSEGDTVEYVVQEGPRGARAENVRQAAASEASAS
ncbi:MAG: cold shock domain-containing protein [Deltaproteobacteria bacterium]|nr:cold shock domain-containing protein [Deltaproteobacteria bacterium]